MDKIQKIKQEIERRIDLYSIAEKDDSTFSRMGELSSLIDFIDSLPEESASEDLEEELRKILNKHYYFPDEDDELKSAPELAKYIAFHFAEWQKQKDEELFSKDSWNYIEENYPYINQEEKLRLYDISIKSRLAGANTIKKQMKEALQTEYEKGRFDMREEMKAKEHILNIISCLEEYLQPGFPIFKAGISKEITWLNSLISKNY